MKKIFTYADIKCSCRKSYVIHWLEDYFLQTIIRFTYGNAVRKHQKHNTKDSPKIFYMDIQQHKEILLKWIRSCQTAEQLDLLSRRVTEFVVKRFSEKIEYYEMELAKEELSDAIIEQRVITARERQPIRLNTYLQSYQMNRIAFHDEVKLHKPRKSETASIIILNY
jgi:hypothetical protein